MLQIINSHFLIPYSLSLLFIHFIVNTQHIMLGNPEGNSFSNYSMLHLFLSQWIEQAQESHLSYKSQQSSNPTWRKWRRKSMLWLKMSECFQAPSAIFDCWFWFNPNHVTSSDSFDISCFSSFRLMLFQSFSFFRAESLSLNVIMEIIFRQKCKIGEFATHTKFYKIQFIFNLFSLFADFDEISVCLMKTQPSIVDRKIFHLFIAANVELVLAADMIPGNNSMYVNVLFSISS